MVLVVIFVISMGALSIVLFHRDKTSDGDQTMESKPPAPPVPPAGQNQLVSTPRREYRTEHTTRPLPIWLDGGFFPSSDADLATATQIIETLLAARRDGDLARGFDLYTPALRRSFLDRFGLDESRLADMLDQVEFQHDPPHLRSVELVDAVAGQMTILAGYTNNASECYRLVRNADRWLIDAIELECK